MVIICPRGTPANSAAPLGRTERGLSLLVSLDGEEDSSALTDVVTDPNAVSLPPHIAPEMLVGFGLTMGKLVVSGHMDEVVDTIETNIRHI